MDILDAMIAYHYEGACDDDGARSRILINGKFYNYFSYFYDVPPQVLVYELMDGNGNIYTKAIDMENIQLVEAEKSTINFGFHETEAISYKVLDEVGYVVIPSFDSGYSNVEKDFDSAVKALKEAQVKGVVLDVRYNGGGDQSFRKILGYLTDEEINIGSFRYRESSRFRELCGLRPLTDYIRSSPNDDLTKENGYTRWWSWNIKPGKEQFLTTVPVVVLSNETIFSSAGDFVDTCLEYKLATVVGSSVPLSGFGLSTPIVTPSGKYVIHIGFQENVDSEGQPMENVIKEPHVYVEQSLEDFYSGVDTVLQTGIKIVLE